MRGIILHIILLLTAIGSQAQVMSPLGKGLPAAPDKIANHKNGLVAAYDDRDGNINVQIWNGDFWHSLPTPMLPKTGDYQITDIVSFGDEIYLMTSYTTYISGVTKNSILKWDNNSWLNTTNATISDSRSLNSFFVQNGILKCVGVFQNTNTESNVAQYVNDAWEMQGNLITSNLTKDSFISVVKNGDRLFATGTFTNPQNNNLSLVEWNGTKWTTTNFPPFLQQNIALGSYNDKVVAYGTSTFNTAPIKINDNGNWKDLDAGLQDISIRNITQFAELDNQLLALGSFVDNSNAQQTNLLLYDGQQWKPSTITLPHIDEIHSFGKTVALSGDYDDNGLLRGVAQVHVNMSQIITRVFEDKNGNCTKDANESWIKHHPVKLNEASLISTGENGVMYARVASNNTYKLNAAEYRHYVPTCDDITLEVTENATYYGSALGVRQTLGITDAAIYLTDNAGNTYQPGDQKNATLCVNNFGSQPLTDAIISLDLPAGLGNFVSSTTPTNIIDDVAQWSVDLSANTQTCIDLAYNLNGTDDLKLKAQINPQSGIADAEINNNQAEFTYYSSQEELKTKYCLNGKAIEPNEKNLNYKISYKNDNAATVTAIKVVDILDDDIIRSVEGIYIKTSHATDATIYSDYDFITNDAGNTVLKIVTTIENIAIPPSSVNEALAGAFVDYQIGIRSDLMDEDAEICNTAKIYLAFENGVFDEPITTNTVCSFFGETLTTTNTTDQYLLSNALTIGPNPVTDHINISNSSSEVIQLQLVNSLGKQIDTSEVNKKSSMDMDVSSLASGIYFVYANGLFAQKVIIQ